MYLRGFPSATGERSWARGRAAGRDSRPALLPKGGQSPPLVGCVWGQPEVRGDRSWGTAAAVPAQTCQTSLFSLTPCCRCCTHLIPARSWGHAPASRKACASSNLSYLSLGWEERTAPPGIAWHLMASRLTASHCTAGHLMASHHRIARHRITLHGIAWHHVTASHRLASHRRAAPGLVPGSRSPAACLTSTSTPGRCGMAPATTPGSAGPGERTVPPRVGARSTFRLGRTEG